MPQQTPANDGAEFNGPTTIGGVGTIGGQVDFNASTDAKNITGAATAVSDSSSTDGLDTDAVTTISSDGTLQGFDISSADALGSTATSGNNYADLNMDLATPRIRLNVDGGNKQRPQQRTD